MAIIVFILFVWLFCKGCKALFRRKPRIEYKPPAETENKVMRNIAALDALQQQRDIYDDLISEIDYCLENAPANREKLLKEKAMLFGKLATVENKIHKLTG